MLKKTMAVAFGALFLSGCSVNVPTSGLASGGSIWKSSDAGQTFVPKVTVDEKRMITSADVLSFVFDPKDAQTIYISTKESGIFKTTDGAEHWTPIVFPPTKNYGFAIDQADSRRLYASGVYNDVSKLYRSDDAGENWKEIYTEPGKGTVITALGSSPDVPAELYAGTSAGVVIKSTDGGDTWKNVMVAKGPVTQILFERGLPDRVTLLVINLGVTVSPDGGKTWNDYTGASAVSSTNSESVPDSIATLSADPHLSGVLYAGAKNGLFRSHDGGKTWEAVTIIESSKKFLVRAVAVNPANSSEITYAAGNAFYRSTDGGTGWATTQLEIDRGVSIINYDPNATGTIYFALRKF